MSHINTSFQERQKIMREMVCSECGKQGKEICDECFNESIRQFKSLLSAPVRVEVELKPYNSNNKPKAFS